MKAVLYNRILLFLGFVGLFVAGVLSLAKFMHVTPPCGVSKGCDIVTNDRSSVWFGVPVAYLGLFAYIVLTGLALLRAVGPPKFVRPSTLVSYLFAVGGTLISIGLQFYSFFVIHEMCKWCLTSAVTMTITLIVTALLYQEVSETPSETVVGARKSLDFLMPGVLGVLLVIGLAGESYVLKHEDGFSHPVVLGPDVTLIPNNPNLYGEANAPVTIVEFADLNCPSCQANSPMVKEFVREHEGKVRLIYRHLPLPVHKTSGLAAFIDEYAAEKGHFWDYTMAVMGTKKEIEDPNELYQIASSLNLDVDDIKKRLANDKDPIYQRLTNDQNTANVIGVKATPTFIVLAPGVKPNAFGPAELQDALRAPPYKGIIDGGA